MNIERMTAAAGQRAMSQGAATYAGPGVPGGSVSPITAVLDREYEVYETDEQLPRRVTVIAVQVAQVPVTHEGQDTITRGGKTWRVHQVLSDDGHERVLEVS